MLNAQEIRERTNARLVLGVDKSASQAEIRAAWRVLAVQNHPDQPNGSVEGFRQINDAYNVLKETSGPGRHSTDWEPKSECTKGSVSVERPTVSAKTVEISPLLSEICRASLAPEPLVLKKETSNKNSAPAKVARHVPSAVRTKGRSILYVVETPLLKGENQVALPTDHFAGKRNPVTEIVELNSPRDGKACVELQIDTLSPLFSGAERVRVQFGAARN